MSRSLGWYARRLRQMSATEIAQRALAQARHQTWATRQVRPGSTALPPQGLHPERSGPTGLHEAVRDLIPTQVRTATTRQADQVLAGTWPLLGVVRDDLADPDWFRDPVTGVVAPADAYAFKIDHRDEAVTGNVKQVWEASRHHHLTLLASAYWLTGEERYAEACDRQLRSWWRDNPFLSGIHWTSGIELGVRLVSWAWVRRLLADWPKVGDLFEGNDDCLRQLAWHQRYLAAFPSPGSSANNHAIAEAVGLVVAACAFPWYDESERWRETGTLRLRRHLRSNTFADGLNRELATDYHRFVTELGLVAASEARGAGHDIGADMWRLLTASLDAAAAMLDVTGRPPRQGDGDEGRALIVDGADDPWSLLLSAGAGIVGACDWWPATTPSVFGTVLADLAGRVPATAERPATRPSYFPEAGMVLLRTPAGERPEIWCRADSGVHGFLSIAAHGHADALSVEVRHDGVEVLVDPGTYCYHGEPEWRSYFRSTAAHNTVEVDGESQAVEGGPFMWSTHADAQVRRVAVDDPTAAQEWTGDHTGYARLAPGGVAHERTVRLADGELRVTDRLTGTGRHPVRLLFHLGPDVAAELDGAEARLTWQAAGETRAARLGLPEQLRWSAHRGETEPVLGWYSPGFGDKVPTTTLVGEGHLTDRLEVGTVLAFDTSAPAGGGSR